jgi:alkanesulfonate monooxygenase SsuD/methylene tetrahydromethanopterin reductase-like flavin-dependent oxidoreductase (luciferase family)
MPHAVSLLDKIPVPAGAPGAEALANTVKLAPRADLRGYKRFCVVESFRVLENPSPCRVDLGVGKAPGGLPNATQALRAFHDKSVKPDFDTT